MIKLKSITLFIFILLLLISALTEVAVYAGSSDRGTSGAEFLKIDFSAKAASMSGAFTAVNNDISSIFYNPAGIHNIDIKSVSFSYTDWIDNVEYNVLSYVYPLKKYKSAFAIFLGSMDYGSIVKRDQNGNYQGEYSPFDRILLCSYATPTPLLNGKVSFGINAKLIHQKIDNEVSYGGALDIGTQIYLNDRWITGLSVNNFGHKSKFDKERDEMSGNLKLGVSYRLWDKFLTGIDFTLPEDNNIYINVGVEYNIVSNKADFNLALRAGYSSINSDRNGFSAGVGFKIFNFDVDYAFLPFKDFGNTHKIGLTLRFGKQRNRTPFMLRKRRKNLMRTKTVEEPELVLSIENITRDELLRNGYSRIIYLPETVNANNISVIGNFNDWKQNIDVMERAPEGFWTCKLNLNPGRYIYKLVIDGKIMPDVNNDLKESDGYGGFNSILYISR